MARLRLQQASGLREGQDVTVEFTTGKQNPVGMLEHLCLPGFQREDEGNVDRYWQRFAHLTNLVK